MNQLFSPGGPLHKSRWLDFHSLLNQVRMWAIFSFLLLVRGQYIPEKFLVNCCGNGVVILTKISPIMPVQNFCNPSDRLVANVRFRTAARVKMSMSKTCVTKITVSWAGIGGTLDGIWKLAGGQGKQATLCAKLHF